MELTLGQKVITIFYSYIIVFIKWILEIDKNYSTNTSILA